MSAHFFRSAPKLCNHLCKFFVSVKGKNKRNDFLCRWPTDRITTKPQTRAPIELGNTIKGTRARTTPRRALFPPRRAGVSAPQRAKVRPAGRIKLFDFTLYIALRFAFLVLLSSSLYAPVPVVLLLVVVVAVVQCGFVGDFGFVRFLIRRTKNRTKPKYRVL